MSCSTTGLLLEFQRTETHVLDSLKVLRSAVKTRFPEYSRMIDYQKIMQKHHETSKREEIGKKRGFRYMGYYGGYLGVGGGSGFPYDIPFILG